MKQNVAMRDRQIHRQLVAILFLGPLRKQQASVIGRKGGHTVTSKRVGSSLGVSAAALLYQAKMQRGGGGGD